MSENINGAATLENKAVLDSERSKKKRVWEIDFVRGFAILLMVLDHLMWNIADFSYTLFDVSIRYNPGHFYTCPFPNSNGVFVPDWLLHYMNAGSWYYYWDLRISFRLVVLILFFTISGISFKFSKNNLKRGIVLLGAGLLITILTIIGWSIGMLSPYNIIPFGVLSCYGVIVLIVYFAKWLTLKLSKNNIKTWYFVSFLMGIISIFITLYFKQAHINICPGPNFDSLGEGLVGVLGAIFGFSIWGGDFFPIFPYLTFFLIGEFIGSTVYKDKESLFKRESIVTKPITFIGRHTIWLYLLHIPVITLFHCFLYRGAGFHLCF